MVNFKKLEWKIDPEGMVFSEPYGLKWSYYIIPNDGYFELDLIDENGNFNNSLSKQYKTVLDAKIAATKHYLSVLNSYVNNNS